MDPTYTMMQGVQSMDTAAVAGSIAEQNRLLSEQAKQTKEALEANKIVFKIVSTF